MELYMDISEKFDNSTVVYFFDKKQYTPLKERENIDEDYTEDYLYHDTLLPPYEAVLKYIKTYFKHLILEEDENENHREIVLKLDHHYTKKAFIEMAKVFCRDMNCLGSLFLKNALKNPDTLHAEWKDWWQAIFSTFMENLLYVF